MFKHLSHKIICLFIFGFLSCEENTKDIDKWAKEHSAIVLDSIDASKLIACYNETAGFSVLEYKNKENRIVRKLTFLIDRPVFIDSLVYIKHNELKSPKFNIIYLIKDSSVITVDNVKIIHPSSN